MYSWIVLVYEPQLNEKSDPTTESYYFRPRARAGAAQIESQGRNPETPAVHNEYVCTSENSNNVNKSLAMGEIATAVRHGEMAANAWLNGT